jgi:O-antigen/teichoic acid export membrane protein
MRAFLHRVFDSTVAWTLLGTLLRVGASVFVLPLVLRKLPPEHLGLWYVFGTLGGFALLLDLGFEATIARTTAYLWAGATRLTAFGFHEEAAISREPNRALLAELIATLRAYYRRLGLGVLLLLSGGGGAWVWIKTASLPEASSLRAAWFVYAFGSCLNFVSGRWPALLTGIGAMRESQQIAIVALLLYYVAAVAGLLAGFGLWALVIATVAMGVLARELGRRAFRRAAALPGGIPNPHFFPTIFAALWPNAWRTGLVSLGYFLIVQANTLVCSAFLGLKTTASYGLTFQLVTMLAGLSAVWVQVKLPLINQLRVQSAHAEIACLFARRLRLTVASFAAGAVVIIFAAPVVLAMIGSKTSLLPTAPLAAMLLIQFLEMHHNQYGHLVLSENHNPFLKPALLSGGAVMLLSVALTPRLGVWGLLLSAGTVQAAYSNWWTVLRGIRGLRLTPGTYFTHYLFPLAAWKSR